jgi:hypothetical protein
MEWLTADMVSAIANCIVAVANVVLFVIGFRTLRHDRLRIARMEESERRRFSENVYVWIEERSAHSISVICRNGGNSAIYNVTVCAAANDGLELGDRYAIELMRPMEERMVTIPLREVTDVAGVTVRFRDPAGALWIRDVRGTLIELGEQANAALAGAKVARELPAAHNP